MTTPLEAFERERTSIAGLAGQLSKKYGRWVERDELRALLLEGLWRCALRHYRKPAEDFRYLALRRARGNVKDFVRNNVPGGRIQSRNALPRVIQFSIDDIRNEALMEISIPAYEMEFPDPRFTLVRSLVDQLPPRHRQIILDTYYVRDPPLQQELAARMGISPPRINQLHGVAIQKLRELLARHPL